jgi:hypothetical protein
MEGSEFHFLLFASQQVHSSSRGREKRNKSNLSSKKVGVPSAGSVVSTQLPPSATNIPPLHCQYTFSFLLFIPQKALSAGAVLAQEIPR